VRAAVLLSVESLNGKVRVTIYGDFGFRRELEVDFVLYGPNGKYSISEGALEGVTAFEVVEVDGRDLAKRGLPAEEGRKYRVLVVFRW
jgi:hypothetical protein